MRSGPTAEALRGALAAATPGLDLPGLDLKVSIGSLATHLAALADGGGDPPDVTIVDVDFGDAGEIALLGNLPATETAPMRVIATSATTTTEGLRHLLKLGIVDYLPQPFTPHDVAAAIEAATGSGRRTPNDGSRCQVLAVVKAGGGAGASTLAVQVAAELTRRDKDTGRRSCLIDLDIPFGTADLYLDVKPLLNLTEVSRAPRRLDGPLLEAFTARATAGVPVLAPFDRLADAAATTPEAIGRLLEVACQRYDVLVLDLPQAIDQSLGSILAASDAILVVLQLTIGKVRQAKAMLDTLASHGVAPERVSLVLNRFDAPLFGRTDIRVTEAEVILGRTIQYTIANDWPLVTEALSRGSTLLQANSSSKMCRQIKEIVDGVLEKDGDISAHRPREPASQQKRRRILW